MKFKIGDIIYQNHTDIIKFKIIDISEKYYYIQAISIDKKETPINWFTIRYIDKYYMNKKDARKMKLKKLYEKI